MQVKQRGKSWNVSFPAKCLPSNVVHKIIYSPPDRIEEIIRAEIVHSLQLSILFSNHSYSEQTLIQSLGGWLPVDSFFFIAITTFAGTGDMG